MTNSLQLPPKIAEAIIDEKVIPEWGILDYCRYAWEHNGHTNSCLWGEKGNYKSALSLLFGRDLLKDYDKVLHFTVTSLDEFKELLRETTESKRRIAWANLDDISVYLPTTLYYRDSKLWELLKRDFTAIRVFLANLMYSAPKKKDVLKLFIDDMNFEVEVKSSMRYTLQRWIHETNPEDRIVNNERAIRLQKNVEFNPFDIPIEIFSKYEVKRLKLAEQTNKEVVDYLDQDEPVNYSRMPIKKIAQLINAEKGRFALANGVVSKARVMGELGLGETKARMVVTYINETEGA